jgi:hypothetical protein
MKSQPFFLFTIFNELYNFHCLLHADHPFKTYWTTPTSREWTEVLCRLADSLPGNTVVNDEEAIDKCVEELTRAIQEAAAASFPKRRPRADPPPHKPATIQDEIRLKNRLRQWQVTRDPALSAQVNHHQRS